MMGLEEMLGVMSQPGGGVMCQGMGVDDGRSRCLGSEDSTTSTNKVPLVAQGKNVLDLLFLVSGMRFPADG